MGGRERIIKLLNTLHTNRELLADLYFSGDKSIHDGSISSSTLASLQKHKLVWWLDDDDRIHLSNTLSKLIDISFQNDRVLLSGVTAAPLYTELCDSMTMFRLAQSGSDRDEFRRRVRECVVNFIQTLQDDVGWFGRYIERGYALVDSFEIRLKQNRGVLEKAEKLCNLLEGIDLSELQQKAGGDPELRPLFFRYLPQARTAGLKELRNIVANLRHLLTKIVAQKEYSSLVLAFVNHYEQHPDFVPEEPLSLFTERCWHVSTAGMGKALPNIYDDDQLEDLTEILAQVDCVGDRENTATRPEAEVRSVRDERDHEVAKGELSPLFEAAVALVSLVGQEKVSIKASEVYSRLQIGEAYDLWLFALSNYLFGLPDEQRIRIEVDYIDVPDTVFAGNSTVTDMVLRPSTV